MDVSGGYWVLVGEYYCNTQQRKGVVHWEMLRTTDLEL